MRNKNILLGLTLLMGAGVFRGLQSQQHFDTCAGGPAWSCQWFYVPAGDWVWVAMDFLAFMLLLVMMLVSIWPRRGETRSAVVEKILRVIFFFVVPLVILFVMQP